MSSAHLQRRQARVDAVLEDVAGAFPFAWNGPWLGLSPHAAIFWTSLLLFGFLFFFRQRHDDAARDRLAATSAQIAHLVQTMPPKDFRAQLAVAFQQSQRVHTVVWPRAVPDLTTDELLAVGRSLLRQLAELARIYDERPNDGTADALYAANVMLFVPARLTEPVFDDPLLRSLRFMPAEHDLRRLKGVLWMNPKLFATNLDDSVPSFPELTLPVSRELKRNGRYTLLPGAPRAFVEDRVDAYLDTHTLGEFCRSEGDFLESVISELHDYFVGGAGKSVRSFISRPLPHGSASIGVLNVHSSMCDILGPAEGRRDIFQALVTPLLLDLTDVVSAYARKIGLVEIR